MRRKDMHTIEGNAQGKNLRFAVILTRTDDSKEKQFLKGALEALIGHSTAEDAITTVRVPTVWDLPLTLEKIIKSSAYDAVIAMGIVARSGCAEEEVRKKMTAVSVNAEKPVVFELVSDLTASEGAENRMEAIGRATALRTLEVTDLLRRIGKHELEHMTREATL
jgi:6,7-dimethyl-8-ribityllumazine synthase